MRFIMFYKNINLQQRTVIVLLAISAIATVVQADWNSVNLPHNYTYPCLQPPCGNRGTHVYSTQFPTAPKQWFKEPDCPGVHRMTSTRWISDRLENIRGISFKGLVYKNKLGKRENEFAVFYHQKRCYDGGPEYGFVFPENMSNALFYICGDCNLKDQRWCQWPGDPKDKGTCKTLDDCSAVAKLLQNPAKYRYWNIKVTPEGNFLIELIDPTSWQYKSCTIKKPKWLPNTFAKEGYITINAQKGAEETASPAGYIHIDEVKIRN